VKEQENDTEPCQDGKENEDQGFKVHIRFETPEGTTNQVVLFFQPNTCSE
jgi:hypothetical protein